MSRSANGMSGGAFHRHDQLSTAGLVIAFHMKAWKHPFMRAFFPHKQFVFVDFSLTERQFRREIFSRLMENPRPIIFVWGNNLPAFVAEAAAILNLDVFYLEDGFIRSLDAHAGYSVPFSLTIDKQRPYFDARGASDLEDLLNRYDFDKDKELETRAQNGLAFIRERRVTKYNGVNDSCLESNWLRADTNRKILVLGQVEDDASIKFGCNRMFTNNDLVRLAWQENPDATIYYKPHPDVLSRMRQQISNPAEVAGICNIIGAGVSLADVFDHVDNVYTITSLAGFEALIRGKSVTVIGAPFYAGWGLTDDRQAMPKRGRKLTLSSVFAAAYILYPSYFDPSSGAESSFEQTLTSVVSRRTSEQLVHTSAVERQLFGPYGILGWRHMLTPIVGRMIALLSNERHAVQYRRDPISFFREVEETRYRLIGRLLYPWR